MAPAADALSFKEVLDQLLADRKQRTVGAGAHACHAWLVLQERHLTDHLNGLQHVQQHLATTGTP